MAVKRRRLPDTIQETIITATDTTPAPVVTAVPEKVVVIWWHTIVPKESIVIKSNTTAISPVFETTGLATGKLQSSTPGIDAAVGYPEHESATGETINLVFGATGGTALIKYSIENP